MGLGPGRCAFRTPSGFQHLRVLSDGDPHPRTGWSHHKGLGKGGGWGGGWLWLETVVLLGILWLFPKTHAASRYDHDYPYIMMFHAMREVSLAFVLFSSAHFVRARLQKGEVDGRGSHFHEGRNYLLLGSICFLVSEFVGIIWCQNGWGDVWRWSTNFFQSALIVLYFMVAFHIPGKGLLAERVRRLVGGTGGVFFLALTLIRGLP